MSVRLSVWTSGWLDSQDDYYALGVENSNVVFRYNLGDGDNAVIVDKNVNDYMWHEVISER